MQLKQIIHLLRKKKGFTLVELLAVIVILAVILVIAVPAVGRIIENSRQEAYLDDERMMEKAARTYALKKSEALPKGIGEKKVVLLSDLISSGILEEIRDPKDKNNRCLGYVEVEKISTRKYDYNGYLKCGNNYKTDGINEDILQ